MPVMLVIALMVRLSSPGTVLYKQERLGINGKKFNILKFRTMREDAEENGPQWAEKEDDRCTKLGVVLRKCRLDELPQLWNILKGDMSFVGPRPERECFYKEFETYIHGFSNRLVVVPGLTGLAQVRGGYDLLPEEKIIYDMEYIKQRSLWLDFKLICKTVMVILGCKGAR
jgi:lipopolysaccharide/colanic/teichoic acid biosynthesis glycosyltransferase